MNDIAIKVENLSKKYSIGKNVHGSLRQSIANIFSPKGKQEEFWALKDINFEVKKGEAIGVIGRNGAGKSTLLKILSKITQPTTGRVEMNGRVSSLLEVGTGFHHELTGRENIYLNGSLLGMSISEIKSKFEEIVDFSGVERFIDTPVKHYSSGMYVRLAFSVAAHLNTEILLIDEVLAVGDVEFQEKCLKKIHDVRKNGKTVLFVSHNLTLVDQICSKKIILNEGKIVSGLNDFSKSSPQNSEVKFYDTENVKRVKLHQDGNRIIIEMDYIIDDTYILPNIGFRCTSQEGNYICSYALTLEGDKYLKNNYPLEGRAKLEILSPILNNGIYHFSFYLSDGKIDRFVDEEGMFLNVFKMAPFFNSVAQVIPECNFVVETLQV